jgi:hypothetical protein
MISGLIPFFGKPISENRKSTFRVTPRRHDRANGGRLQEGPWRGAPKFGGDGLAVDPLPGKKCSVTGSLGKS